MITMNDHGLPWITMNDHDDYDTNYESVSISIV